MIYILLILFPVVMALSCFVLRKNPRLIIIVALATVLVEMVLVTQVRIDDPAILIGVTLSASELGRLALVLFLGLCGLLFVAAWNLPHGENFVPTALLILGQVCAIVLLQDLFVTTLLLVATGLSAVLAIVDLPVGASNLVGARAIAAALKYLVMMAVAGTLMYVAFVLTDIFRPGELPQRISLSRFILALLAVSFALRLALIPFHAWLVDLFSHATPLVSAMVITLLNTASLLVLVLTFQVFPTLTYDETSFTIMRSGALATTLIGGLLVIGQQSLRRCLAYLILYDCGMVFYGLAALSTQGLMGAVFGVLNQSLIVTLLCVSLSQLEQPDGRPPALRRDLLWRWPIAGAGLLLGGLALLGLPPLNGFASKALLYRAAADHGWLELFLLVVATLLAGLGLARAVSERLLGPSESQSGNIEPLLLGETELDRPTVRKLKAEPQSTAMLTLLLLGLCLAIGLYPQPLLTTIGTALQSMAFATGL
jgi:formate hydrogenlyase subunit 3/multisubunit Na+/H+ antiporter MnhD subunit